VKHEIADEIHTDAIKRRSSMAKVSVIIPVYNVQKYLAKCLDSVINQTLKDIEIICVNDGSTDNSLEILKAYAEKDSRIKIISQENRGLSAARNAGTAAASGEYIGFVDSDDWISLDYYEKLYNMAQKTDSDIAVGEIKKVKSFITKNITNFTKSMTAEKFEDKLLLCDIPDKSFVFNKIYKLSKIREHNIKFKEGVTYEDIIYSPQVIKNLNKLVTVPGTFYYYLKRKGSIVTTKTNNKGLQSAISESEKYFNESELNIDDFRTTTKRYKFCGITFLRIKKKMNVNTFILFGIFRWKQTLNK